ncbi:MAG: hypothetical protein IT383_15620 [Deltaproteobacteria bacterium]|nr:hypothetical protein [Deltaproteobacteria bacterium]
MLTTGGLRPRGMTEFANRVYDVLARFTVSPWNVLKLECGWRGLDPLALEPGHLEPIVASLGAQVARMTDDDNGIELMRALRDLLRQ